MTLQGLLKHLPAICGRVLRGRLDLINFIARHRGNFLLASSKVNNSRFFRVRTAPSNFKEHSACDALGIKDFLYMFWLALDVLNLWPNGSCFFPTECSEYEISDPFIFPAYCHIYCKVVFCDLRATNPSSFFLLPLKCKESQRYWRGNDAIIVLWSQYNIGMLEKKFRYILFSILLLTAQDIWKIIFPAGPQYWPIATS